MPPPPHNKKKKKYTCSTENICKKQTMIEIEENPDCGFFAKNVAKKPLFQESLKLENNVSSGKSAKLCT